MLLYTRLAPPKVPKRRSRAAGCNTAAARTMGRAAYMSPSNPASGAGKSHSTTQHWTTSPRPCWGIMRYLEASQKRLSLEHWETPLWCSDTGLGNSLLVDGSMHQPASPAEYNQGLLNEIFTTWAANTIEQDAGLDTVGFDFDVPASPMRLEGQDAPHHRPPSLAMIAPATIASPTIEVRIPAFSEFTQQTNRRALIAHFTNVLSHLIVLREDEGNPFQRLVLPMSQQSPALVQSGRSNIVDGHLKGAMAVMCSSQALTDPTAVFLERAFRFYDVIAALSFDSTPLLPAPESGNLAMFPPVNCAALPSLMEMSIRYLEWPHPCGPSSTDSQTLGGLKRKLALAELQGDEAETAMLRADFEMTASSVELALEEWTLP
ncbi:hypothetical protein MKX07_008822 [Trichoderma sp. CBMAI-0711]|nr:hypothetical protein MKX07_008822 [Trichoderma sp. CBMAI-0711]